MQQNLFKPYMSKFKSFFVETHGAVAIIVGLVFVVLVGFAALAIDVGTWYSEKRQLQFAADAGAFGGAIALSTTGQSTINSYATNDIQLNGCTGGSGCTIVAINNPPASGPTAGNPQNVEVILSKQVDMFLGGFFLSKAPTVQVRAVAGNTQPGSCLVALGPTGIDINVKGGANVVSLQCGAYANSSANNAVNVVGNAVINTKQVSAVGNVSTSGGGTITATNGILTGVSPIADPYGGLSIPPFSGCAQSNFSLHGTQTIGPGVYCGGISLTGQANLTMTPGTYFLDQGGFTMAGQSSVSGTGVTIILTSSTGSNIGSVSITGGGTISLSAPTSGNLAGILFFGDARSPGQTEKFAGGSGMTVSGAMYFPSDNIDFHGNSSQSGNPCFQMVAQTMTFTGGASLGNGCPASVSANAIQFVE